MKNDDVSNHGRFPLLKLLQADASRRSKCSIWKSVLKKKSRNMSRWPEEHPRLQVTKIVINLRVWDFLGTLAQLILKFRFTNDFCLSHLGNQTKLGLDGTECAK